MSRKDKGTRRAGDFGEQQRDGRDAETKRSGVQSRSKNDSRSTQAAQMQGACQTFGHGFTKERMERGSETLLRAVEWRINNPDAWARIVLHARYLARKGQPISAQALIESIRKKALVDRYGEDTKTNNSFAPIFARWLVREYPETARYIKLRRSVFDYLMGGFHE